MEIFISFLRTFLNSFSFSILPSRKISIIYSPFTTQGPTSSSIYRGKSQFTHIPSWLPRLDLEAMPRAWVPPSDSPCSWANFSRECCFLPTTYNWRIIKGLAVIACSIFPYTLQYHNIKLYMHIGLLKRWDNLITVIKNKTRDVCFMHISM